MSKLQQEAESLGVYIKEALGKADLSLSQEAMLYGIKGGDFIPSKPEVAFIDVQLWIMDEKYDDLLSLLKKLPLRADGTKGVAYWYIDSYGDKKYNKNVYFSRDRDYVDGRLDNLESKPLKRGIDGLPSEVVKEGAIPEWKRLLNERDKQFRRMQSKGEVIQYADDSKIECAMPNPLDTNNSELREPSEVEIEEIMPMEDIPSKGWVNRGGKDD